VRLAPLGLGAAEEPDRRGLLRLLAAEPHRLPLTLLRSLSLVAALALLGAASAPSSVAAPAKLVVVGQSLEHAAEDGLYVLNADGTGLRQLTHDFETSPHWSPDGSWIAYETSEGAVAVIRPDGTGKLTLDADAIGNLLSPSPWSPDGTRLAWGGCSGLCIGRPSSGQKPLAIPLDDKIDAIAGFAWSPDGRRLAAVDHSGRLVVAAADGSATSVLSTGIVGKPSWSPDGATIAVLAGTRSAMQLELVGAAAGGTEIVGPVVAAEGVPRWSPDGRRLYYTDAEGIRALDLSSGRLELPVARASLVSLSPDGSTLYYERGRYGGSGSGDVWEAASDGSGAAQITQAFPLGLSYDEADAAPGSVPAGTAAPPNTVALPVTEEKTVGWVDGLAPGTAGGVGYEVADYICDPDAETTGSTFGVWTPGSSSGTTTRTRCGNYDSFGPFAVVPGLVAWTASVIVSVQESERDFAAVVAQGTSGTELVRWTSTGYDKHIGRVGDLGDLVGDGSQIAFETWGFSYRAKKLTKVHRHLWRVVPGRVPSLRGVRLPADAGDAVAADGGRIALLGTQGVLLYDARLRLVRRIAAPAGDTARLGGDELAVAKGTVLRVYGVGSGRLQGRFALSARSGDPRLLSVRNGYAVYASGLELHLLRLRDGDDRIVDLPGAADGLDAVLTSRGLFASYDAAYDDEPGRIAFTAWSSIP
jgi:hypothetical protein